ncbi:hypothetical protein ACC734_16845 [Rhizobium ruizarguesonis]
MKTIISFLVGAMLVVGAQYWLWRNSLGSYNHLASYWIQDLYTLKGQVAANTTSPKILIMSGSNAMFGIDSRLLASIIGKPVVNMATHGGLSFDFLTKQVLPHVKGGDIVVVPLEFEYYRRDPNPSDFEIINMESWAPNYVTDDFVRSIAFFRSSSMLKALRDYLAPEPLPPHGSLDDILARADINSRRGVAKWDGYSVESANAYGDMLIDQPSSLTWWQSYMVNRPPRTGFLRELVSFRDAVEAKGATLFLTWPTQMRNPKFFLPSVMADKPIGILKNALSEYGLQMHCDPVSFHFKPQLFFNTEYHLGLEGAERRSIALAECLTGKTTGLDPASLAQELRHRANGYDQKEAR